MVIHLEHPLELVVQHLFGDVRCNTHVGELGGEGMAELVGGELAREAGPPEGLGEGLVLHWGERLRPEVPKRDFE